MIKFLIIIFFTALSQNIEIDKVSFLEGTWKIENRQTYEVWEKVNATTFKGNSYKISNGNEVIQEYLKLEFKDNQLI